SVWITLDMIGDTSTSRTCGFYPWAVTTSNAQSPAFCDTCPPAGVRLRRLKMGCLGMSRPVLTDRFLLSLVGYFSSNQRGNNTKTTLLNPLISFRLNQQIKNRQHMPPVFDHSRKNIAQLRLAFRFAMPFRQHR